MQETVFCPLKSSKSDGNLYSSQYMVYKGKGGVANGQSDAGCKGNRQIGTCMFYYTKSWRFVDVYIIIIIR